MIEGFTEGSVHQKDSVAMYLMLSKFLNSVFRCWLMLRNFKHTQTSQTLTNGFVTTFIWPNLELLDVMSLPLELGVVFLNLRETVWNNSQNYSAAIL